MATGTAKKPTAIHSLIPEVMKQVGSIKKENTNQHQRYQFRSIDQFYASLQPVFADLGIFIYPQTEETIREERQARSGIMIWTVLKIRYTIMGPEGDKIEPIVVGEAFDSGDKGCNKAMSAALKYLLTQVFLIPTEDLPDADAESPEIVNTTAEKAQKQMQKVEAKAGDLGINGYLELVDAFENVFAGMDHKEAIEKIKAKEKIKLDPDTDHRQLLIELLKAKGVEFERKPDGSATAKMLTATVFSKVNDVLANTYGELKK